jgi:hypothetical protein
VLLDKKVGYWRVWLFGYRAGIFLNLVTKSALAWQVFVETLHPV